MYTYTFSFKQENDAKYYERITARTYAVPGLKAVRKMNRNKLSVEHYNYFFGKKECK